MLFWYGQWSKRAEESFTIDQSDPVSSSFILFFSHLSFSDTMLLSVAIDDSGEWTQNSFETAATLTTLRKKLNNQWSWCTWCLGCCLRRSRRHHSGKRTRRISHSHNIIVAGCNLSQLSHYAKYYINLPVAAPENLLLPCRRDLSIQLRIRPSEAGADTKRKEWSSESAQILAVTAQDIIV